MEIKVLHDKDNKVLNRKELVLEIDSKQVPDRKKTIEMIASKYNTGNDKIVVEKIETSYGENKIKITARIYGSLEELKTIENKYLMKRVKGEKDGKEEGQEGEKGKETTQETSETK